MEQSANSSVFRIIICGGGIAGLTLANALQHASIDYILLEGRSEIAPQLGASIGMAPNGSRILDQLGCYDDILAHVAPLTNHAGHNERGDVIHPRNDTPSMLGIRHGYEGAFLDRQLVLQALHKHVRERNRIYCNKKVTHVDHLLDGITVYCTDGTSYHGSIVVGADGVRSKIREEMWRMADEQEPGAIPLKDRVALTTEFKCLFGFSTPVKQVEEGMYDVVYAQGKSLMFIAGKGKTYFFLFEQMDRVYSVDEIPRFTKSDAKAFAEKHGNLGLFPNRSVTFSDVWRNRQFYTLTATEEANFERWTWGRFVCAGDSAHKDRTFNPSSSDITNTLQGYQRAVSTRTEAQAKYAHSVARLQALSGTAERITIKYFIPIAADLVLDMQTDSFVNAGKLDYLPPPARSLSCTVPYNESQGIGNKESIWRRALFALPLLALAVLCTDRMNQAAAVGFPTVNEQIQTGFISENGKTIQIPDSLFGWKWLDDIWRPIVVFFGVWICEIDPKGWWQMLVFIADFGVVYAIMLTESVRRANVLTLVQFPILIALPGQLLGIGKLGPIYFYTHYLTSQPANYIASDQRLTNLKYTRSILPTLLCFFTPHYLSHFHPSFSSRLTSSAWWQLFPLFVPVLQIAIARSGLSPDTVGQDRKTAPRRDVPWLFVTVGACVVSSALTWLSTLFLAPFSMAQIFVPYWREPETHSWAENCTATVQWDYIFLFAAAALWIVYLFYDLRRAGMVQAGWGTLVVRAVVVGLLAGPGAMLGVAWLGREWVLVRRRHKDAVLVGWGEEKGVGDLKGNADGMMKKT
ncbi:FAD/NAD(P)-binding domain-containing protein [Patellaria atrata CBS 101060]|uniref:FAD/NAD(P)-binding domain-containing protein n=1 Tax=Patellaria atrata CBS 101060 TaxID=1346257 RepID=A0A9P4S4H2_9PEZI|nr:FAD/NAD(P)-binding domain-containing protein [Patellaria atrata CBS 101060]